MKARIVAPATFGRRSRAPRVLAGALLLVALAAPGRGEVPSGPEVRLNSTRAGDQQLLDLDTGPDGDFVALWQSRRTDTSAWKLVARLFTRTLTPASGEIVVATLTDEVGAWTGRVAMSRTTGHFVVVWSEHDGDGLPVRMFARRYSAAGAALGSPIAFGAGRGFPDVARHAARFVVVWQQLDGESTADAASYDVVAARFSQAGVMLGGPFAMEGGNAGDQHAAEVAMNATERFVVAFEQDLEEHVGVAAFTAVGGFLGVVPVSLLGPLSGGSDEAPYVAMAADGRIFVHWTNDRIDPPDALNHGFGVRGVLLAADGTPEGQGRINVHTPGIQASTTAALNRDGGFLAGWISYQQDGSGIGVYMRRVSPTLGPELRVNVATAGNQYGLRLGTFGDGHGVAAWSTPRGGAYDVVARRLVP